MLQVQVATCMKGRRLTTKRILAAAFEVFSSKGYAATTREIAEAAGVNEVTLFRQFATKEHLLEAVTRELVSAQAEALERMDFKDLDLRRDLTRVAVAYDTAMRSRQAFIRTMMSQPVEPKLKGRIMREVIQPLRQRFISYLAEGQRRGVIRRTNPGPLADAFTGMIFSGVLRSAIFRTEYSRKTYLKSCVDLFLQGILA